MQTRIIKKENKNIFITKMISFLKNEDIDISEVEKLVNDKNIEKNINFYKNLHFYHFLTFVRHMTQHFCTSFLIDF